MLIGEYLLDWYIFNRLLIMKLTILRPPHISCYSVGVRYNQKTTSPKFVYHWIACCEVAGKTYVHAWPSMVSLPRQRKKKLKPKSSPSRQLTESGEDLKLLKPPQCTVTANDDATRLLPTQTTPLDSGVHRQRALEIVKVIAAQLYPNFIPPRDTRKRKLEKKAESLDGGDSGD